MQNCSAYYQSTVQNPVSLMVWSCISVWGVAAYTSGNVSAEEYIIGFKAAYAPIQTMSLLEKVLNILARYCSTTCFIHHNSMALQEKSQDAELTCSQSRFFTSTKHLVHHKAQNWLQRPRTGEHLESCNRQDCNNISLLTLQQLVSSLSRCLGSSSTGRKCTQVTLNHHHSSQSEWLHQRSPAAPRSARPFLSARLKCQGYFGI